ncbi:putative FAD dependent oxidoreductase domain-containing protein [Seiridium cardinale]|uniref:FAD dependent oxidoreductase domain-containing protein n=1 Tax=Seiridium cardinale TaxID=138064 RepID=A0ABR2X659_9PEZI
MLGLDASLNWALYVILVLFACFMDTPTKTDDTYVVVGAGVFGTSVAFHLIQTYPSADVVLIDRGPFPHEAGASWDWNKAVRADYTNPLYMELALEAMELWRSDPLYKTYYHQSGLVWLDNKGLPQTIIDNYNKLNASENYRMSNPEEVRKLWDGVHENADYTNVTDIFINESSGWVEATKALTRVIEAALAAGVRYIAADIKEVIFDDHGAAKGVQTSSGDALLAKHVILATGAYTPKLLMDSAPERKEIHAGHRIVAAGICETLVNLNDEEAKYFRQGPVFVHEVGETLGSWNATGGVIPTNPENQIKFYRDVSFTNTILHEAAGQNISVPPNRADYDQWNLSPGMKTEVGLTVKGIYGDKSADWKFTDYRICWDAITPSQDHVICEHPHSKNLYIVTGGSFHSWKFLPILGKYAIQMITGNLDAKLVKTWAWDREDNGGAHEGLIPHREMRDI